jgi:uncharacterized protein YndB with AHSA1/START domain
MEATAKKQITVETTVHAPIDKVWESWTEPRHIVQWNTASPDWHTPRAENDLRAGGKFLSRMEAKDGSFGFDFYGVYDEVKPKSLINYTIGDGRKVKNSFTPVGDSVKIVTVFEAEEVNSPEMQKGGWQAIMDSFKTYTEKL